MLHSCCVTATPPPPPPPNLTPALESRASLAFIPTMAHLLVFSLAVLLAFASAASTNVAEESVQRIPAQDASHDDCRRVPMATGDPGLRSLLSCSCSEHFCNVEQHQCASCAFVCAQAQRSVKWPIRKRFALAAVNRCTAKWRAGA